MTKARQLIERAMKNWPIKLICFIVAILLYIFHQSSLYSKRSFVLPLNVIQNGIVMPVDDYAKTVTVVIRANTEKITSVHPNQIRASITLNDIIKNGEYLLPVNISVDDELQGYDPFEIKVKPEAVNIKVEKKSIKYLKIEPSIVGEPAHGYQVSDVIVRPAFVEAFGPESLLSEIDSIITKKIDITNIKQNGSFEIETNNINSVIKIDNEGPYAVFVKVDPMYMEKTFANYKIQAVNLSDSFNLVTELPYANLKLSGTVPQLEKFNLNAYSVQVDFSLISQEGQYELPVKYIYPNYFTLVEKSINTVNVVIEKKVVESLEETLENKSENTAENKTESENALEGLKS